MKFKKISCVWKFAVLRNIFSCDYLFTSPLQASATALTSPNHYLTHLPPSSKENIAKPTVGSITTWNTLRRDLRRKSLSAWSSTFLSATFDTERLTQQQACRNALLLFPVRRRGLAGGLLPLVKTAMVAPKPWGEEGGQERSVNLVKLQIDYIAQSCQSWDRLLGIVGWWR